MTVAPWKTCADQWAQDLRSRQDNYWADKDIDDHRRMLRKSIAFMKERDELFLRTFISVLVEELK